MALRGAQQAFMPHQPGAPLPPARALDVTPAVITPPTGDFVPTRLACRGLEVLRLAHRDGDIGVIVGAPGLGKSMILKAYAAQHSHALLIDAIPGYSARVLLEALCQRLTLCQRGNIHALTTRCVQALRGSGHLLMVDEAELLPVRALEVLRRLHDHSGIGLVLVGTPRLLSHLRGKRGELAQLYSRVGLSLPTGDVLLREDFDLLAISMMPEATDKAIGDALYDGARGNARRLSKLLCGVRRTSEINHVRINVEMVRQFATLLI
jgi:Uncharacterized ATPase, putative transposase